MWQVATIIRPAPMKVAFAKIDDVSLDWLVERIGAALPDEEARASG
jgi:hypothetical protein